MLNENKNIDDYGDVLSVRDVCEILHIGYNTAYRLLKSNKIENFKIGAVRKIPKLCLIKYIFGNISEEVDYCHTYSHKGE